MFIRSKIKETGTIICQEQIADGFAENGTIWQTMDSHIIGDFGQARSTKLSTAGLCILEVNYTIQQKITDLFVVEGEYVHMSLFFQGQSRVMGLDSGAFLKLDSGLMRVNFEVDTRVEIEMQPSEQIRYISIIMSREYFLSLLAHETWTQGDVFIDDVLARRYFQLDKGASLISHQILDIVYQIFDAEHPGAHGSFRKTFVDMKLKEMLFLVHLQHRETIPTLYPFDPETVNALHRAKALLVANFAHPPTIRQLSRDVSLNEQKLKQGFKQLYGTTIYAYIVQLRMEGASQLILNPAHSINQIASQLGYQSTPHFITAFKKYFGCTPKQAALQKIRLLKIPNSPRNQ